MKRCCSSLDPTHLAPLDLVPPVNEVPHDIEYDRARQSHVHIMPRHTGCLQRAQPVADVVRHILEVHNPRIVVVLSREKRLREIRWMGICKRMGVRVPTPKAEIQTADTGSVVVDHNDFFVVGPELDIICIASL